MYKRGVPAYPVCKVAIPHRESVINNSPRIIEIVDNIYGIATITRKSAKALIAGNTAASLYEKLFKKQAVT
jgi:hypothetical protein